MELKGTIFKIELQSDSFGKNDILVPEPGQFVKVLEKPYRIWYKLLWEKLTFGYYKSPYQYKVENIKINGK